MVRDLSEDKEQAERTAQRISERCILDFLMALRSSKNLSQADIAQKMRCTQSKISKLESGKDDDLRLGDFHAYTAALGMEMTITLAKSNRTIINQITSCARAFRRMLLKLAQLACHHDESIANGAGASLNESAAYMARTIFDAAKTLKKQARVLPTMPVATSPKIEVQQDDDDTDADAANECELTAR
jgi:transcriptional regulator with XRE-family HTH domain